MNNQATIALMRSTAIPAIESPRQARLSKAIDEFYAAIDVGHSIDRERLLEKYADIADELEDCLNNLDFIQQITPQLAAGNVTPPSDIVAASPRAHLGDFRILRELGRGGMGVVYEAEQISLGRHVALKVLPFAAMLDKQQLARFKNEARAAATLDHPNIVAIYSVGSARGVHYYAMQLIEGRSLAEIIAELKPGRPPSAEELAHAAALINHATAADTAKAALPTVRATGSATFSTIPPFESRGYYRTIARLGIQAAEALDHAHQNGILHRDIKPANLLLDDDGKLWITDFGLARIEQDAGMTMTGDLLGTLRYMSPEQALAKRVVVDHRSDIYSLGVTLYELIALRAAYAAMDRQELLRQIAFEEPKPLRQISGRIPDDLETIVGKAIEKNPTDRYASAQELAEDLRRFVEYQPIMARSATAFQRLAKWSRRHVAFVWSAAAILMISTLVFAASSVLIAKWYREAEVSANSARDSATESKAVIDFLVNDLLAAPFDERKQNRDATISSVLTNAEARISKALADRPLAEAAVQNAMAKSFQALLEFDKATPHAARALDLRRQVLGPTNHETLESMWTMAELLVRTEKRAKARQLVQEALVLTRRELGDNHPDTIDSMNRIVWQIIGNDGATIGLNFEEPPRKQGDLDDATELCDEALTRAEKFLGAEHLQTLRAANLKTLVQVNRGKCEPAVIRWRQNLELSRRSHNRNDPMILAVWVNVAQALQSQGHLTGSKIVREALLDRQREASGDLSLQLMMIINLKDLGMTNLGLDHFDDARKECEEALAISNQLYGADNSTTVACKYCLADVMRAQTDGDGPYRLQKEVVDWERKHMGAEHPTTLDSELELAYDLELIRRWDEALALLNEIIETGRRILPAKSETVPGAMEHRATIFQKQGKEIETRRAVAELIEYRRKVLGEERPSVPFGQFRILETDPEPTKKARDEAIAHLKPNDWRSRNTIAWNVITHPLADVRDSRLAMKLVTEACVLTDYKTATVLDTLAAVYAEDGDFKSAIKWADKAIELATPVERKRLLKHMANFKDNKPWRAEVLPTN